MDASVTLATTYLQLNGYFVLTELPVQVADRHGYRTATDLDVLAVRLPHAAEVVPGRHAHALDLLLGQDTLLDTDPDRTEVLIAEVKRGRAQINDGYHDVEVLRFSRSAVPDAARRRRSTRTPRHWRATARSRRAQRTATPAGCASRPSRANR